MKRRNVHLASFAGVAMLLTTALLPGSLAGNAASLAQSGGTTFPQTGKTVSGTFLDYWNGHGGLAQQGYPISDAMQEQSPVDGKTYTTQYFERAVFEMHPENQPPYNVLLSLLGDLRYKQKYPGGAPNPKVDTAPGAQAFPQTGHTVGGVFLAYWQQHGGLMQQGYPISDEFTEVSDLDGKPYTVQYFERAVFEMHPENQPPNNVLLSQLGTFQYKARYGAASGGTPTAGSKPNIIFILTDDERADDINYMPHLQQVLQSQGTSFSNYFVTDSLCCPSRAAIQRGQYVHNTGVLGNQPPNGGFEHWYQLGDENSTIATWLQADGYRTGLMGKYLNGYPNTVAPTYIPPGWNEWDSPAAGDPYSEYNYTLNEDGKLVKYGSTPDDYMVDVLAKKATTFIQSANSPFFLYLATYAPHQPATPAPRHANLFPDVKAPRDAAFNEADVSDKPQYIQALPLLSTAMQSNIDDLYRKRLQSLQSVDEMIGNLVTTLQVAGKLDNTYIVFTSDNGFHLGQHRLAMGKQTAYETDIHVPLIVRGPAVPAGKSVDPLAIEVDLAPTFLQMAGTQQQPAQLDGRSLMPLVGSNPPTGAAWRDGVLIEHYEGSDEPYQSDFELQQQKGGKAQIPTYKAIRTPQYTYVEYITGEKELYDLHADPNELQNIVSKADPTLLNSLSVQLAALAKCSGASCRTADSATP